MTSKERMMRALARQKPDRLPCTVHQWQPYHLAPGSRPVAVGG